MDDLTLINKALLKCGLPLAAAVGDADWNAAFILDTVKEECLREACWNFATQIAALAQANVTTHGWLKTYSLPGDCLRVVDVHQCSDMRAPKARYELVGGRLACNVVPCYLRYITKNASPNSFTPDFANAVSCRVAGEIAALSAQNYQLRERLMQEAEAYLQKAMLTDARESVDRVPLDRDILARRGGMLEDWRGR